MAAGGGAGRRYDARVKAMEVDEKPTEDYSDIGGLDKQIQELIEAVVRPMTHRHLFQKIGIRPPKGCLLYGPPGTGKTLLARACAAKTNACYLKLAAPQLVQVSSPAPTHSLALSFAPLLCPSAHPYSDGAVASPSPPPLRLRRCLLVTAPKWCAMPSHW
jgi:hypothetical protein